MNIAIIGSRDFTDYKLLSETILSTIELSDADVIVSGGAKGADNLGEEFAKMHNLSTKIFKPDWSKFGKSAGFRRNIDVITNADIVFAFRINGSKGTTHSISIAEKLNKRCIVTDIDRIPIKTETKQHTFDR